MPWVFIGQELFEDLGREVAFHLAKETYRWLTGKQKVGELFGRDAPYNSHATSAIVREADLRHVHLRPHPLPSHISRLKDDASPTLLKYLSPDGRARYDTLCWDRDSDKYKSLSPEPRKPSDIRTYHMTSDFSVVYGDLETKPIISDVSASGSIILVHAPESEHEFSSDRFQLMAVAEMLEENRELFRKNRSVFYCAREKPNGEVGIFRINQ